MEKKYIDLDKKIQSMTAKEIILAMVDSLKNPVTKINMETFGCKDDEGICFGCAATNTILKLGNLDAQTELTTESEPEWGLEIWEEYGIPVKKYRTVHMFEQAINYLRMGFVEGYNEKALEGGFATIKRVGRLPAILTINCKVEVVLQEYIDLANAQ